MRNYFPPPNMNEAMYYLNDHSYYLRSFAEPVNVYSPIGDQTAKTSLKMRYTNEV